MGGTANAPGRRLLVVTESLGVGGTESHLIRLLRPLANRGWNTTVCCITGRGSRADQLEAAGICVIAPPRPQDLSALLRRNPTTIALGANRLFWLLRRWRPQIVHFYLPGPYLVGAPLAIAAGVPIKIMSRRSLSCYRQRRPFLSRIEPALHRHMDAVIGNSRAVVSELESEGIASDKIRLIYNGIEASVLPDRVEARRRLDLDPGTLVGVVVANLISYKGHTDLIEALGQISERLPAGWRVLCAGRDQGFQSKLERLAAERGVKTNVRFLGEYTDVPALLAGADFSVLSSWEEGFSNVILESMSARLPMIVTDVGGNPEAVVDGETGLVVPSHDPSVLGQAILRLACDAGLRDRLGGAGQKRAEQEFSIERCVASHHALYEELLARLR
jgi:glycosyltransferase involved in cell wall biosynthesis